MELGSGLLQGWFSPLLSSIGQTHGVSAAAMNWVSTIFLLASVLCVPILAKLGDILGHKRILAVSAAAVAVGSFVVAFAPSFEVLLVGRALQAPLIAFLPLEFAIVRHRDPENAGRSIGRLVGALTLGAVIGGLGAGVLLDQLHNLTLVLLVPAVFMALCVPVVVFLVPETTVRKAGTVDWAGALLLGFGLLALLGGVSNGNAWGWSSPLTIGSIVLGVALLIVWVLVERKVTFPLVDLNLILRGGIGLPIVVAFLFGAQLFGSQTPSALFLRADPATLNYGLGMTSSAAGLVLAIFAFTAFLGATVSDRVARWFGGPKAIMAAGFLGALAYVLMIFAPGNALTFTLWLSLSGFSGGVIIGALPTIVVNRAPADSVGIASAVYNTARTAAGAAAGAVFALVMSSLMTNSTTGGTTAPVSSHLSYQAVWGICAGISVVLAVLAGRMGQPQANPQDAAEADASLDGGEVEKEKESAAN
jgi:MFS family permease